MLHAHGNDPDDWRLDRWLCAFHEWARQAILGSGEKKGEGEAKWREFERELWAGEQRSAQAQRQGFAAASSALTQLGAMRG